MARGSKKDADMDINKKKTKTLQVAEQKKVPVSTVAEMKKTEAEYKHQCIFCPRRFKTARGLKIHMAACNFQHELTEKEFEINDINAVFGTLEQRWFRVCWKDSWEPERSLRRQGCNAAIRHFWQKSSRNPSSGFLADPDDVWRCYCCGKGYNSERGLATYIRRTHTQRQWTGSSADRDTRQQKRIKAQDSKQKVICDGKELKNVWAFIYLGARFSADGSHLTDVKARVAKAMQTAGKMRHIWASSVIPLRLKLRVYVAGVCSQLTYGSEARRLDETTTRMLNGVNSRLLHRITEKSIKEEASQDTRTFDLVRWIRARRAQWLGHILRMEPYRMIHQAVQLIHASRTPGDLLMDAPDYSWEELKMLAANRDTWRSLVNTIKGPRVSITMRQSTSQPKQRTTKPTGQHSHTTRLGSQSLPNTKPRSAAEKYRDRDAHEAFFRRPPQPRKRKAAPPPKPPPPPTNSESNSPATTTTCTTAQTPHPNPQRPPAAHATRPQPQYCVPPGPPRYSDTRTPTTST